MPNRPLHFHVNPALQYTGDLRAASTSLKHKGMLEIPHVGENADLNEGFTQPSNKILSVSVRGVKSGQNRLWGLKR